MSTVAFDASALLDNITPEQIVNRLQELDRESRALRVLLRATRTRQGGQRGQQKAAAGMEATK